MMGFDIRQLLLFLHILLGIIWVGGVMFVGWGVFPAAKAIPFRQQRLFFTTLMKWSHWIFTGVGIGVIATGILLGVIFGPIQNTHVLFHTTYGVHWLAALIIASFVLLWGIVVGYRQAMRVFANESLWDKAEHGNTKPLSKSFFLIAVIEAVEVIGFIVIVYLMVTM